MDEPRGIPSTASTCEHCFPTDAGSVGWVKFNGGALVDHLD